MVILAIWFIIFVFSIKPLVSKSRRAYRTRTKSYPNLIKSILLSIIAHVIFVQLIYENLVSWMHWISPLLNVMFVIQVLLIFSLVWDNYDVVDTARVTNDNIFSFLLAFTGILVALYFSVYVNNQIFNGLCVSVASIGAVIQLMTYKNIRK